MLQIQTIMDRAEQGITSPFICMAENSLEYFVKGLHATRASQINEWIGGNIAQALSLPVAPFDLLEVGEELYEELPARMKEIGKGICFGSQTQKGYALLEPADIPRIDIVCSVKSPPSIGLSAMKTEQSATLTFCIEIATIP